MTTHYLACDLGAESGRLIAGQLNDGRVLLEEIHRFPNSPIKTGEGLHWNIEELFSEIKRGLHLAAQRGVNYSGFSTDAWGVDYMLFDSEGQLLSPTFHYRDARTDRGVAAVRARVSEEQIFGETGIQFMPLNTIYQLAAETPDRLRRAHQMLLIADGFHYLLSGVEGVEESMASTTQLYNPQTRAWSHRLIDALGFPVRLFPRVLPSGTQLGRLRESIAAEVGLPTLEVIAGCSHDTGAAVAAVPAEGTHWAYLSSGTWSLMGVECLKPQINPLCQQLNFTNELGYGGTVRLLKNIIGMWLVQECRRDFEREGQRLDYEELTSLARKAKPFSSLINPGDPRFLRPDQMVDRIQSFCQETGQVVPSTPGELVRCILESLALLYRRTLEQLEQLTGTRLERLHIVGGGSKNQLLNQWTANALGIPVCVGPVEAAALGNILVQAITLGHLPDLTTARAVVRDSFDIPTIQPQDVGAWSGAYERFLKLL